MSHPHGTLKGRGPNDRGTTPAERFIWCRTASVLGRPPPGLKPRLWDGFRRVQTAQRTCGIGTFRTLAGGADGEHYGTPVTAQTFDCELRRRTPPLSPTGTGARLE
jgi:hypothetical protein